MGIAIFGITYGLRHEIPKLFSVTPEVNALFQDTILYVALFCFIACIWVSQLRRR